MLDDSLPEGSLGQFRDWKLCSTEKNPGWVTQRGYATVPVGSVNSNGTGKPVNFFIGARVSQVYKLLDGQGNPIPDTDFLDQGEDWLRWVNGAYGARAQIDFFTLGFGLDGENNPITETYDFEPAAGDPPAHFMYASGKSLDVLRSPLMASSNQWTGNLYKITGLVLPETNRNWFVLEDGSKLTYLDVGCYPNWIYTPNTPGPIRCYLQDDDFWDDPLWIGAGVPQLVTVYGYVEPLRFAFPNPPEYPREANSPLMMWTNINNVKRDNILDMF
jgi:hypothetical protein